MLVLCACSWCTFLFTFAFICLIPSNFYTSQMVIVLSYKTFLHQDICLSLLLNIYSPWVELVAWLFLCFFFLFGGWVIFIDRLLLFLWAILIIVVIVFCVFYQIGPWSTPSIFGTLFEKFGHPSTDWPFKLVSNPCDRKHGQDRLAIKPWKKDVGLAKLLVQHKPLQQVATFHTSKLESLEAGSRFRW